MSGISSHNSRNYARDIQKTSKKVNFQTLVSQFSEELETRASPQIVAKLLLFLVDGLDLRMNRYEERVLRIKLHHISKIQNDCSTRKEVTAVNSFERKLLSATVSSIIEENLTRTMCLVQSENGNITGWNHDRGSQHERAK